MRMCFFGSEVTQRSSEVVRLATRLCSVDCLAEMENFLRTRYSEGVAFGRATRVQHPAIARISAIVLAGRIPAKAQLSLNLGRHGVQRNSRCESFSTLHSRASAEEISMAVTKDSTKDSPQVTMSWPSATIPAIA